MSGSDDGMWHGGNIIAVVIRGKCHSDVDVEFYEDPPSRLRGATSDKLLLHEWTQPPTAQEAI